MSTDTYTPAVGDRVIIDPAVASARFLGKVYIVDRFGPKNAVCSLEGSDRPGDGVRCRPEYLKPAPPAGEAPPLGRPFVPIEFFDIGQIVTVVSPSGKIAADQPMVVIDDKGKDRVNIAPLGGGDGARYWRWPRTALVKRDIAWLTERLVEMA
jgi:hypothetical protein